MAENNAFTAGVKPGGLTNSTEIRLLLCYLIKAVPGLTRSELETALLEEELANYFEIMSGLDDILRQELVVFADEGYTVTAKGAKVAAELAYDLPTSVREAAVAVAIRKQTWNKKITEYSADLTPLADGQYGVKCTIKALPHEAFSLNLTMPDKLTAETVKENFILKGSEIYELFLTKLTQDNA